MDSRTASHLLNLEGRVVALSGIVALLICALRQRQTLDPELERQIYAQTSEAVSGLPPELENGADRLILALQASARAIQSPLGISRAGRPAFSGFAKGGRPTPRFPCATHSSSPCGWPA